MVMDFLTIYLEFSPHIDLTVFYYLLILAIDKPGVCCAKGWYKYQMDSDIFECRKKT